MTQYRSRIDPGSDSFVANREEMLALVKKLRDLERRTHDLSERRRSRFEERGQLTPRERLSGLLDPGLPFLELYNMANYLVDDQGPDSSVPGASMICGIGFVSGVRCMVFDDDVCE